MKRKILITGGSGFLGGHLIFQAQKKFEVFATYHKNPINFQGVQCRQLDLRDSSAIQTILDELRPDVVIHNAAVADIDFCEKEKNVARAINYHGTEILAKKCKQLGLRLIYVSTDNVFDGKRGNYSEDDLPNPINYYGETKQLAEEAIASICQNFVIARAALIYGAPVTAGSSFSEWIFNNLKAGNSVTVFVDQFRTPIYAMNLSEALLELAESDWYGTIHLGGPQKLSRYGFAKIFCDIFGFSTKTLEPTFIKDTPFLAKRPLDLSFNISKAQKVLNTQFLSCEAGFKQMKQ